MAETVHDQFCSLLSAQAGEPLFATATTTQVYLLLEDNEAWGKKAVEESRLPEAVRTRLTAFVKELPAAKFQLIKGPPAVHGPRFFVAITHDSDPALYEFQLQRYEDLLELDLAGLLSGAALYQIKRCSAPLYLVCTNGRRDACCAKFGLPVYEALQAAAQGPTPLVWQMSHVGGHRFAPNLLYLSHGLLYGRMTPQAVPALLESHARGELLLEHLRGRTAYSSPAQAAESFLHQQTGIFAIDAFRLLDETPLDTGRWQVRFTAQKNGQIHSIKVILEEGEQKVYDGCALDKQTGVKTYTLGQYTLSSPAQA